MLKVDMIADPNAAADPPADRALTLIRESGP